MKKILGSDDDDDDDDLDRPSPLLQTQRFTKSGTIGTKDLKMTPSKPRHQEVSNLKIDLNRINDNDDDSLNDSDDDTNTKTGRSTSSATSQLTPKPKERSFLRSNTEKERSFLRSNTEKERSFLRSNTEKPKIQPRRIDIDDDDRNVFGQTTMKPSPRHQISTLREDEEKHQSFMQDFQNVKKRQSPTDLFQTDHKSDSPRHNRRFTNDHEDKRQNDSDEEIFSNKQTKPNNFQKSRHSPTHSDRSQSRKNSNRSKEGIDQSDSDDNEHFNKQSTRQDYRQQRQSMHDFEQTSPKDTDYNAIQHQSSSSRPGSASKKEVESARRSSYCEDEETVIPPITNQKSPSRPTSAKSNTTRQQTQSIIDSVTSANAPLAHDPLTANNEALAATLRPSSPPVPLPRPSARLPPRPKSNFNTTRSTSRGINKKQQFKTSSRYKEVTSRVDTGRTPITPESVSASVERAHKKAVKSQTLPRPQSSRVRNHSANSINNDRQRRRSSSGYEHVKPRVNTNLSINFDELNTSQMRAESSQSIKDGVYMEWLKAKEEQRKQEKEELKRWQEEQTKRVDKSQLERKVKQDAQNLERWRQEKEEQMRKKRQEEIQLQREHEENKKREHLQKKKDAKDGFIDWAAKKDEVSQQKIDEDRSKKTEIEKRQEEKQERVKKSEKAYAEWMEKKEKHIKKTQETTKTTRDDQLKKIRENEETKFVTAQEAYEKWLKEKDKYEFEDKPNAQRRNSLSAKQQQVPFLPGGSQKNTGKVQHVVW